MALTTLYYFLGFVLLIVCFGGIQKWYILPQPKKDKIGLIILSLFIISLLAFILITIFSPTYFSAENTIITSIIFVFLLVVFTAFFIKWYNDKYNKKINIGGIIIALALTIFGAVFLFLKYGTNNEKENIIQNVALNTTVTNITFDSHKPYFKDMHFADSQHLPMPETMNNTLQIGDSIYKNKNEKFYTVVNAFTKKRTIYEVKTHERVLGKAQ